MSALYSQQGRRKLLVRKPRKKQLIKYKMIDQNKLTMYKWFNKDIYGVCMAKKRARGRHMDPVSLPPEMAALRNCLKATSTDGSCAGMMDAVVVQRAAAQLPGVKLLMKPPVCLTVTREGVCTQWRGNKETEGQNIRSKNSISSKFTGAVRDLRLNQWKSCALVGRNPMIKLSRSGPSIDQHEAVWRFNLDTPTGSEEYVGNTTTVRVLNQGSANKADGKPSSWHPGEEERWIRDVKQANERLEKHWIVWNVRTNRHVNSLAAKYKPVEVRQVTSIFINWMLDVYFSIMADLEHIGVSSFNCAEINSLPSGTHAVFMAAMACEKVDLYGVSYTKDQVFNRAAHVQYTWTPYLHHGWDFDGYLFRLLHLAGKASICTRDDKSVSTEELMNSKYL
eukprot:CAMPEP_0114231876 /NCGR_PEP_ID=MMETSP0058-20121206/4296_1 /TAXON_ID=36894 /ORGANISM="Pyramimonas parkeae, CCMP726" /LENGTH=392 /DNA_ID=CAMNT_0001343291 /DNA_START=257 /DNA_END=1435 /DNA_ORIENTATION=+